MLMGACILVDKIDKLSINKITKGTKCQMIFQAK